VQSAERPGLHCFVLVGEELEHFFNFGCSVLLGGAPKESHARHTAKVSSSLQSIDTGRGAAVKGGSK